MLKIKFANGAEQEYSQAVETEEYYNGSNRRTLTFEIERDKANLETLDELCSEPNCEQLELINTDEEITNIYEKYVLKLQIGIEQKQVAADPPTYEEIIKLKLGKRTYIEQMLHDMGVN